MKITSRPLANLRTHHLSLPQLFEDLQEKERNVVGLQSYASLLVQRIMDNTASLLPTVVSLQSTTGIDLEVPIDQIVT